MRLQKYMAMCGVAARRKCEEIIAAGRVAVNGETITQMGTQVEDGDVVTLDGRIITPEEEKRYILYHKPAGEVTTVSDDKGRETVMDRFADFPVRLYPVGRLDYDSEGLLLLTNDGELAQRLTHPSCEVDKVYLARVTGNPSNDALDRLRRGVYMEGDERRTYPAQVRVVRDGIVIHEGHLASLQRFKDAVKEVASGYECGLNFEKFNDIKEGDVVEAYVMEQIEQ